MIDTNKVDLPALLAACEAATPGEWRLPQTAVGVPVEGCTVYGPVPDGQELPVQVCFSSLDTRNPVRAKQQRADAAYIVASQPQAIKALILRLQQAEEGQKAALKECVEWATKAGLAKGKLETSELAGIVEGWQERATTAEAEVGEWKVNANEYFAALQVAEAKCAGLVEELRRLYRAYVNLLEAGRDRIIGYGGSCDPVDRMEEGDPALIRVRATLKDKEA